MSAYWLPYSTLSDVIDSFVNEGEQRDKGILYGENIFNNDQPHMTDISQQIV